MSGPWIVAFAALAAVTALNGVLLLALARYVGSLAGRLPQPIALELSEGPAKDSRLEDLPLPTGMAALVQAHSPGTGVGRPTLIAFLSTTCASCATLVGGLNAFAKDRRDMRVVSVISGRGAVAERMAAALRNLESLIDTDGLVAKGFAVGTVPFALFYREGRLVAKGVVNDRDMLDSLADGLVREHGDELLEAFVQSDPASGGDGP